jgi:autotransporter-associated beta strand protein
MKTKYSLVRVRASRRHFIPAILASAFVCSLLAPKAQGADIYWDRGSSTNAWGTVGNWSTAAGAATPNPAAIPGTGDVAVLNISTLTSNQTLDLGADRSVGGISAVTAGTKLIQGGGANRTLTLGASGLAKSGTGALTIGSTTTNQNANVRLSADQTWTNNNNTGAITVQNTLAANSAVARKLTLSGTSTAANRINATITNNSTGVFSLEKTGTGLWIIANNGNTFTGNTVVSNGTLRLFNSNSLGTGTGNVLVTNTGSPASIDNNSLQLSGGATVTRNLVLENLGGSFARVSLESVNSSNGNNNNWNGNITFKGGSNQAVTANNAPFTINGNLLMDASPSTGIFIRGGNAGTINGTITLGTASILKTDGGTWRINSTGNTHGNVTVANGGLILGATNALQTTASVTHGETNANNGRLELQGVNQTITRWNTNVASTGTNHIARNNDTTTASTLTFATPTATTDILKNVQIQGSSTGFGVFHLVSNGLGRTEFQDGIVAANSLTVNSGTVAFTGNVSRNFATVTGLSGATIEKLGTGSLIVEGDWDNAGTTNIVGGMLALGAGTAGDINVADSTTLSTGLGGGVLTTSAVTFGSSGATTYAPIITNPGVAPLSTDTLTNAGTTVTVAPLAASFSTGTYRLLDYTSATGLAGFTLAPLGSYPHITATLDTATSGQVNLVVTAVDSLIWTGQTNNTWDVDTTSNFALASSSSTAATFYQGDSVAFGDTHDVGGAGTPVTNRTITGAALNVGTLTFDNSLGDYSVAAPLTVAGSITKDGTSALTFSGSNLINGSVSVNEGTLKIGHANALAGNTGVTVASGATIDADGITPGTRYDSLTVSGTGVGGNGAVVNNGAALINLNHFNAITLAGDTTWGGSARYDVTQNMTFNGGSNTLTKTGAGDFWYSPAVGHTIGNIIVNQGVFGLQFRSNILETTSTVTVNNTGIHRLWGVNSQHPVIVNEGGAFESGTGTSVSNGVITLNGTGLNKSLGGAGALNTAEKMTGDGGFTKVGAGAMNILSAANDFTGDVRVLAGALNMSPTGVIPATVNLTVDGGTFDTWNRNHTVASISGSGGRIYTGTAAISRLTTTQSTSTVANTQVSNVVIEMSGTGSLTLGGTLDNSSGSAIVNSGTLVLAKGNTAAVGQAIHAVATGNLNINGGTVQLAGTYDNTTAATGINAPPAGINTSTYGDLIYNNVAINLNAGTLDMNGRQEAVNQLLNPTGVGGTITNTSATASKLYIGHQNGASTFAGAINDGTGTVAIEKIGTGALTLSGTSNFTGGLTQTAGTIIVPATGVLGNTPITITANTFTLDGTHGTGAIALNGTSTFTGSGTSTGLLTAATGTTIQVGAATAGTSATTLGLGGLNVSGGAKINLDFNAAGTVVDKIATTTSGGVTLSGTNDLNVALGADGWVTGTYPIITYAGAVTGATSSLNLTTPVGHSSVAITDDMAGNINLVVTAAGDNKWVGGASSVWDINTALNWSLSGNVFLNGDTAVFDDTATTFAPTLATNVTPAAVVFDNTTPYTLTGTAAGIIGTGGLTKTNTGTATLVTMQNTYTGVTLVEEGTLIANMNTGTLVATATTTIPTGSLVQVDAGATLKVVANDGDFNFTSRLAGSGTIVIDPHFTAATGVRGLNINSTGTTFTGKILLSPSTGAGTDGGTFRNSVTLTPAGIGAATVEVDEGAQIWLSANTFPNNYIITGHGFSETAGGTPIAASGLTAYTGTTFGGIGAIRMENNAVITGNITLEGNAKIMSYGATGTIAGSISTTNATDLLVIGGGGSGTNILLTGTNNVGANALKDIFVNSGSPSAQGQLVAVGNNTTTGTLGTGSVLLNGDAGTATVRFDRSDGYTLDVGNTIISSGSNTVNTAIRLDCLGGFNQNEVPINLGSGGLLVGTVAGRVGSIANLDGDITVGRVQIGTGVAGSTVNFLPGVNVVNSGNLWLGEQANLTTTATQTGGAVTAGTHARIGHWPGATSVYNISAGTLTMAANAALATDPSNTAESNGGIYLGVDGAGTMNQSGGTVTTDWVVLDNRGDSVGVDQYNLSGGSLELRGQYGISNRSATTEFNFTGGTIKNIGVGVNARINGLGTFTVGTGGTGTPTIEVTDETSSITASRSLDGTGALTKTGDGTLTLNGAANTYTGATTVSEGTLALVGGSQASPITVSTGASLSFTLGSPTTSTSSFDLTNGTVKISGTPTLASYTLISDSTGITGTPTLDSPIAGYNLYKFGNSLVLATPYGAWAINAFENPFTQTLPGQDQDGDTFVNLMEYAFGTDPTVNSSGQIAYAAGVVTAPGQPVILQDGGVWYAVFGRRTDYATAGLTYTVQFTAGLDQWTDDASVPTVIATDGTIDAVRVPFPNFVGSPSGPKKPNFFRVQIED